MNTIDPQTFRTLYKNLPENVKEAYSSVEVTKQVEDIGKKHNLHLDKMDGLNDEIGWVMIGVTHPRDFVEKIAERLAISKEDAHKVATDVNEQIFRPIRESLKKIHQITDESSSADTSTNKETVPTAKEASAEEKTAAPAQTFEPTMPGKEGDVPENLPSETDEERAPGMDKEYPITEPIESRVELLRMIEDKEPHSITPTQAGATAPTVNNETEPDIVQKQLKETTHTPHEKVEHYGGEDPYREPIE